MLGAPLNELLVTREHGIDQLIEHVLGRLAQEVGIRVQRLVVLAIESGAVLHELLAARARLDQRHGASRSGRRAATTVRTTCTGSRGVSDPPRKARDREPGTGGGSLTPRFPAFHRAAAGRLPRAAQHAARRASRQPAVSQRLQIGGHASLSPCRMARPRATWLPVGDKASTPLCPPSPPT